MTNININTLVGDFSGILHSILCELGRIIGTYMLGVKGSVKLTNFFLHNSLRLSNSYNNNSNNMYFTKIDPKPLQSQLSMNTVFPRMLTADTISFRRREAANTK